LTVLFSLMSGLHSFNAMEEAIKDGDFDKFYSNITLSSADTIPYALIRDGLKVVAIDGTHVFTMRSERLGKDAHKYEHTDDNDEIRSIDCREKAIVGSYIGEGFSPIIKMNQIAKGEGEATAAKKENRMRK